MIEIDQTYFSRVSKLVNEDGYNKITCSDFDAVHFDEVSNKTCYDRIKSILAANGFCVVQMPYQYESHLEKIEYVFSSMFGEPLRDKNPEKYTYTKVKAEDNGRFYVNSHLAQPMHTDEGYTARFPRYAALYCAKQAEIGGDSIMVQLDPLYSELVRVFGVGIQLLFETSAVTVQNAYGIEEKSILFNLKDNLIGISYSPVLQKMWCRDEVFILYDYITQYLHNHHNQFRFRLKSGQALLFDNCRVLHGRTAFPKHDSRLLYRYWYENFSL